MLADRVFILHCVSSALVPMVCCGTWQSRSECGGGEHKEREEVICGFARDILLIIQSLYGVLRTHMRVVG